MTNAYIVITPDSGITGTIVNINGYSFAAFAAITVTFEGNSKNFTADGSGNFTGTLTTIASTYDDNAVIATDGVNMAQAYFKLLPAPEYCTIEDIADWLSIDITENSNPSIRQVTKWILQNQETFDYLTGHTWQANKSYYHDQNNVWSQYHWGRGMPIYLKHRFVQPYDDTQGDTFEIWDGQQWQLQPSNDNNFIYFDEQKGIAYIRGYLYTVMVDNRFRIKYRYGGNNEGNRAVPRDITKALTLMTCRDLISRDFKFSQVAYGAEGSVPKNTIMQQWQNEIDKIIWAHSEIHTII